MFVVVHKLRLSRLRPDDCNEKSPVGIEYVLFRISALYVAHPLAVSDARQKTTTFLPGEGKTKVQCACSIRLVIIHYQNNRGFLFLRRYDVQITPATIPRVGKY